jgi:poly(3-hydroxybutyrate) depolymerase
MVALSMAQVPAQRIESQSGFAWVTPEVKALRVSFHTFESDAAKGKVSYHIYKPAAYDREGQRRFPVVYWLHGSGGGLAGLAKVAAYFDAAIEAGKTPPCFVVFVNGLVEGMYVDWKDGSAPIETMIVKELVPHIDAMYRTIATREGRLLDGYSMGGYGAARLGFKYPDLFRAVSIMGGGPLQAELIQAPRAGRQRAAEVLKQVYGGDQEYFKSVSPRRLAEQNAEAMIKGSLVRQVCGDKDETFGPNRDFHEHLERLKIPHTWTVLPGVDHNPMKTLEALGDSNWKFYRAAFGQPPEVDTAASNAITATPSPAKADGIIKLKVKEQERRAIVINGSGDSSKRPTVIVLHGGMGSAAQMRATSGFDKVAKANGFMAVYAEGTDFGSGRHAWNTGFLLRRQVQDADDIAYFDTLIDTLVSEHGADPTRIYMTGGSNGGMMTYVYAVARAERLAAIAPVVASMFTFDNVPSVPLPILIINGAKDEEIPIEGGMSRNPLVRRAQDAPYKPLSEVVQFWVRVNNSETTPKTVTMGTATTKTYSIASEDASGAVTEYVVDSEGAHGWPGSPSRREGVVPIASFSGAERVWEFFKDKHR